MAKQKCCVKVCNSQGESWTTLRGAKRLIDRGLATGEPRSGTVQMIEEDHRYCAAHFEANAAKLAVIHRQLSIGSYRNEVLGLPNFVPFGSGRGRSSIGKILDQPKAAA